MIKQLFKIALIIIISTLAEGCNEEKKPVELSSEDIAIYMTKGDSISNHAQNTLITNVSSAIKQGGTDYAVAFCNTKAISLTDSIGTIHQSALMRLTDKNRNPQNALAIEIDQEVWKNMRTAFQSTEAPKDYIKQDGENVYFYRPIFIGMTSCLQCHGGNADIDKNTRTIIEKKYPTDKALDYEMNDLRGMWKIALKQGIK